MNTLQKIVIIFGAILTFLLFINCTKDSGNGADNPQITPTDGISFIKCNQTLGNTRSFGLSIADVDLDNDQDIFFANYTGPSILWINNGNGTFTLSSQVFNVPEVHDAGMEDLNGDDYPDVFLLSHAAPSKIYFNEGDGTFSPGQQDVGGSTDYPQYIDLGDVDNDGDIDALIYNFLEVPNRLWLNDGVGFFTMVDIDYGGSEAIGFELADFNGDLFPDLFMLMRELPNQIWINDGTGEFVNSGYTFGNGGNATDCKDYDNDGDMDIAISGFNGVTIWLNQANAGTFISSALIEESAYKIKLIDADLDGDYDLITTHFENGNKLWLNEGTGIFAPEGQIFGSMEVHSVGCADFDDDEDWDVVFGQLEGTGGNSVYLNESTLGTGEIDNSEPTNYKLHNNYPNPFKSGTTIEFTLAKPSDVMLKIYDAEGRDIKTLINAHVSAGIHTTTW
nr:VCBS repeat-containing protein [Bacteroidota bacterium]